MRRRGEAPEHSRRKTPEGLVSENHDPPSSKRPPIPIIPLLNGGKAQEMSRKVGHQKNSEYDLSLPLPLLIGSPMSQNDRWRTGWGWEMVEHIRCTECGKYMPPPKKKFKSSGHRPRCVNRMPTMVINILLGGPPPIIFFLKKFLAQPPPKDLFF